MYSGQLVFAQLMAHLPLHTFRRCVQRYPAKYPAKTFSHLDQFLCLAFAQLTFRESLRDIETCMRAHQAKLYHLGIRGHVAKSTLADANEQHDWRIYADFAASLIQIIRTLYANDSFAVELKQTVYALDTTTIDLCLSVFPWAHLRSTKAAVKLHTLLDLRVNLPTFIHVSDGKMHEVNVLDILIPEAGSFYVMDRGFLDFSRLYGFHQSAAFFVIRAKSNLTCRVYSHPVDKSTGRVLRSNHRIDRHQVQRGLSVALASHQVLRRRTRPAVSLPDIQFCVARIDRRPTLSLPVASRTVLQVDQTAPATQAVLWRHRERRQDTNLDRHHRFRAGGPREEAPEHRGFNLHNFTDFKSYPFRENTLRSAA